MHPLCMSRAASSFFACWQRVQAASFMPLRSSSAVQPFNCAIAIAATPFVMLIGTGCPSSHTPYGLAQDETLRMAHGLLARRCQGEG